MHTHVREKGVSEEEEEGVETEEGERGQTIPKPEDHQEVRESEQDDKEPIRQQGDGEETAEAYTRHGYVIPTRLEVSLVSLVILRVYYNKNKMKEITLTSPEYGAFLLAETVF